MSLSEHQVQRCRDGLNPSQLRTSGNENPEFIFIAIISGDGFNPSLQRMSGNENPEFLFIAIIT